MNHLLHQITWHQYLTTALITAIIYYVVLILRCYQPELEKLRQRFSGKQNGDALEALQYQAPETEITTPANQALTIQQNSLQESISEKDILIVHLKACIAKAADKPFAPAILIPRLKQILQLHNELAAPERPLINHLIADECEKTGTALLTEEEVDQWWES